jgi:excisionase family DNA binding protein
MPSKSSPARLRVVAATSVTTQPISQQIRSCPTALTVDDVAGYLNLARKTIYSMSASGRIPSIKIGAVLRFDPAILADWIDNRTLSTPRRAA